jgi:hypothetical protein
LVNGVVCRGRVQRSLSAIPQLRGLTGATVVCYRVSERYGYPSSMEGAGRIFTIGHSNHPAEVFTELLKQHSIEVVVDARSSPYSKFAPQFDRESLKELLPEQGVKYLYMGEELGGRPEGERFYDSDGHVLYGLVAETPVFLRGVDRLLEGIAKFRVALLCAEEDPSGCHRRLLVGRVLVARGISVEHIRRDGSTQSEAELEEEEAREAYDPQLALFDHAKEPEWKSIPSVLRKKRQNSSSAS